MEPPPRPPHPLGCHKPRKPDRAALDAIFFVLRTGCQWNALRETGICSSSAAHRRVQEWTEAEVFAAFWREGLLACDETAGVDWTWLALDGARGKAPLSGEKTGPNPTVSPQCEALSAGQGRGEALVADRRTACRSRWRWRGPTATTTS